MFTVTDFLNLISFLQGNTITPEIDNNIQTLVKSEQAKTNDFFTQTIDTTPFLSDDYKRLKRFFVDWYASHKTVVGIQKNVSDPHSLPDVDLNELIISLGFNIPESFKNLPFYNKTEFFLDLVNLYKIKGTPLAVIKILGYFGFSDVDLIEYWLKKNSSGNLIFSGQSLMSLLSLSTRSIDLPYQDIDYEELILNDPHWFLTEPQVQQMFLNNKIRFPSKSPFFSVRPTMYVNEIEAEESYIARYCQAEYDNWQLTGNLDRVINLSGINILASILELYVSMCYSFDEVYSRYKTYSNDVTFYDGTSTTTTGLFTDYKKLIGNRDLLPADVTTSRVLGRLNRKNQLYTFRDQFTLPESRYFLSDSTAGYLLNLLNPNIKEAIDSYLTAGNGEEIVGELIQDMGSWLGKQIGLDYTNFSTFIMGLQSLRYLTEVLNFFKPYRARLILSESVFVVNNPLADSVFVEDELRNVNETDTFVDFDTADSKPGYMLGVHPSSAPVNYITSTQPSGENLAILSMYIDPTGSVKVEYDDDPLYSNSNFIYSNPPIGGFRITNIYLYIDPITLLSSLSVDYDDVPEVVGGIMTNITSVPVIYDPPSSYVIKNIYLNNEFKFTMNYNDQPYDSDSLNKRYYSRNTFDSGSYFDLGASCDDPTRFPDIIINESIIDKYNYHSSDSIYNVGFNYTLDEGGEVQTCYQYGGFTNMDEGGVFDAPFASEIVQITVVQHP